MSRTAVWEVVCERVSLIRTPYTIRQSVVQTLYPADVGNTKMHYQKRCDSFNRKFTC